jgi:hypothetical protein
MQIYGTYVQGKDAFDEGMADTWMRYFHDQPSLPSPCPEGCIEPRSGLNATRWCGPRSHPPVTDRCYIQTHDGGEVIGGAFWKMRERKRASDPQGGADAANLLLTSLLFAYDDVDIGTRIRTHLLLLDDDDKNLRNGTPRWADIDRGFAEHGLPALLEGIPISAVTDPGITSDENGPYTITAQVAAAFSPPLRAVELHWRLKGEDGFNTAVPMTNTVGDTWSATLPGQDSPAVVEYFLRSTDSTGLGVGIQGQTVEYPVTLSIAVDGRLEEGIKNQYNQRDATPEYSGFKVGTYVPYLIDDLENAGDWRHGSSNDRDDWEWGTPQGLSGSSGSGTFNFWSDPDAAYSGVRCWGNDLGLLAGSDGAYVPSADNWLGTPSIALAGGNERVFLRFRRWLSVDWKRFDSDEGVGDKADIAVCRSATDGSCQSLEPVWLNHEFVPHVDAVTTSGVWKLFETEITGAIGGASTISIRWGLSDTNKAPLRDPLGGWTIDDVEVYALRAN